MNLRFGRILILAFVSLTTVPLVLLAILLVDNLRQEMLKATHQQLAAETGTFSERIHASLLALESGLVQLSSNDDVATALENPIFAEPAFRQMARFATQRDDVQGLALFGAEAESLATYPESFPPPFLGALEKSPRLRQVSGRFFLDVPILQRTGGQSRPGGRIVAEIDFVKLISRLSRELKRPEARLDFSLADRELVHFEGAGITPETTLLRQKKEIPLAKDVTLRMTLADSEALKLTKVRNAVGWAFSIAFLFMAVSIVAGGLISRALVRPIQALVRLAEALSQGRFDTPSVPVHFQEFRTLERAFLFMKTRIMQQLERLRAANLDLERLAEEGRRISSHMTLPGLSAQIAKSFQVILGSDGEAKILFSDFCFPSHRLEEGFYPVDDGGHPVLAQGRRASEVSLEHLLRVESPSEARLLALIEMPPAQTRDGLTPTLRTLGVNVANTIANILFVHEQREQERLAAELETARLVQEHLLPEPSAHHRGPFELASFFKPATECGGDWWNAIPLANDRLLVLLGDVTGHGVASALLAAVVKGYCDSLFLRDAISLRTVLAELNTVIRNASDGRRHMTMFAALLDPHSLTLRYANAAHHPPYVLQVEQKGLKRLVQIGSRLGFAEEEPVDGEVEVAFGPRDTLFLFSDGLLDCTNPAGEPFGEKRLRAVLSESCEKPASGVVESVEKAATAFFAGQPQCDDVTFVAIGRT